MLKFKGRDVKQPGIEIFYEQRLIPMITGFESHFKILNSSFFFDQTQIRVLSVAKTPLRENYIDGQNQVGIHDQLAVLQHRFSHRQS